MDDDVPSALAAREHVHVGALEVDPSDGCLENVVDAAGTVGQHAAFGTDEQDRRVALHQSFLDATAHRPEPRIDDRVAAADLQNAAAERIVLADEGGDESRLRLVVDVARDVRLLDHALRHHRDPVGHGQRLALIVGDVDEGDARPPLDRAKLGAHVLAELEVEGGQRLVEQQDLGLDGQRPCDRDPLALTAGQLRNHLFALIGERDQLQQLVRPPPPRRLVDAAHFQAEGDVFPHLHQREQGEVLEDQRRRPLVGADAGHVLAADPDEPAGRFDETGNHPQDRRLAAAGRPEKAEELA